MPNIPITLYIALIVLATVFSVAWYTHLPKGLCVNQEYTRQRLVWYSTVYHSIKHCRTNIHSTVLLLHMHIPIYIHPYIIILHSLQNVTMHIPIHIHPYIIILHSLQDVTMHIPIHIHPYIIILHSLQDVTMHIPIHIYPYIIILHSLQNVIMIICGMLNVEYCFTFVGKSRSNGWQGKNNQPFRNLLVWSCSNFNWWTFHLTKKVVRCLRARYATGLFSLVTNFSHLVARLAPKVS